MEQVIGASGEGPARDPDGDLAALGKRPKTPHFSSLAACTTADVPVYIPTFNNPTYADHMVRQLRAWGCRTIILMDNDSTLPEMLDFLHAARGEVRVIRLPENRGPQDVVLSDANYPLLPDVFCVTDPDLAFNPDMPGDFLYELLMLTHRHAVGKAGLALDLSDRHLMREETFPIGGRHYRIWEWEAQFWTQPVGAIDDGSAVFRANVDTTFALYNKQFFRREAFYEAVRLSGRYTCRHLPWYRDTRIPASEEAFYKATQKHSYHMR